MKRNFFEGKIDRRWFSDYIYIILTAILIAVISYGISIHVLYREVETSTVFSAKQLGSKCDDIFSDVSGSMWNCSNKSEIKKYSELTKQTNESVIMARDISRILSNEIGYSECIESLWIYCGASDTIINTQGSFNINTFYHASVEENSDISYQEFISLITTDSKFKLVPLGKSNWYLIVNRSMCTKQRGFTDTTFIGVIRKDYITRSFEEIADTYNMDVIRYSKDGFGGFIYQNKLADSVIKTVSEEKLFSGKTLRIGGKAYRCIDVRSEFDDFSYLVLIPLSNLRLRIIPVLAMEIVSILIMLIVCIYMSFKFVHRNYTPIKNIMQDYGGLIDKKPAAMVGSTELDTIIDMLSSITKNYKSLDKKYHLSINVLKSGFLNDLVDGKITDKRIFDILAAKYKLRIVGDKFAVIVISVDDKGIFQDDNQHLQLVFSNIMEELINTDRYSGFLFEHMNYYVCMVNAGEDFVTVDDMKNELYAACVNASQIITDNFEIRYTFSISGIYDSFVNIRTAFLEAMSVIDYNMLNGTAHIFKSEFENNTVLGSSEVYSPDLIMAAIKTADDEKLKNILHHNTDTIINSNNVQFYAKKCMLISIPVTIYNFVSAIDKNPVRFTEEFENTMKNVHSAENLMICRDEIYKLGKAACDFVRGYNEKNKSITDKTDMFIEEHYDDVNLSVAYIADNLNLHSVYLSSAYKKKAGISIPQKITQVRMKHAAVLLQNGKYNIRTISEMVGYSNDRTFSKNFKETYGVSPSQFKL